MRLASLLLLLALPIAGCGPGPPPPVESEPSHHFEEIAPGVHFARGTGSVNVICNAMVVVNDDHVVVVDSHVTPDAGSALVSAVATLTDKPIRYLVNTHFHFDHAHGNAGFPAETTVVAHEETFRRLSGDVNANPVFRMLGTHEGAVGQLREAEGRLAAAEDAERAALEREVAMLRRHADAVAALEIRPPDLAVKERLTLHEGGREIQLLFLGRGHTAGDLVVWLPAEKIVFTGDLLQPIAPFLGDSYPDEWVVTLEALAELPFEWVLPGHGAAFQDRALMDQMKRYLQDFTAEVRALRAQGHAPAEAAKRLELDGWREYASFILGFPPIMELQVGRIYELDGG